MKLKPKLADQIPSVWRSAKCRIPKIMNDSPNPSIRLDFNLIKTDFLKLCVAWSLSNAGSRMDQHELDTETEQ